MRNLTDRSLLWSLGLGLALWCAGLVSVASATSPITEFPLPTPNMRPTGITAGPDGALWFTEWHRIGRVTTTGTVTEFSLPTPGVPGDITVGPDGALWFTETSGNKIGRMTTTGTVTEFPLTTPNSRPDGITAGPDGAVWFTLPGANAIGRITTAGTITEFPLTTPNSRPAEIAAGPDGALWFTENGASKIGRITTAGTISEFILPAPLSGPEGITVGPDGALWFTETAGNRIGRITTTGTITEFALPAAFSRPDGITAGPDGALWFTEGANKIGRISTTGTIFEVPLPTANSWPTVITVGPDGALWFTEERANKIGRIVPDIVGIAAVSINGSLFHLDQTITYAANLTPGPKVTPVDIYLGALMPDGVTFLSLVDGPSGTFVALGPSPIPFQTNVTLTQSVVVPFSYRFEGFEPVGRYVAYAHLTIPGSHPLVPEKQFSVAEQPFQFSSDVCLSLSVSGSGSVTKSPLGNSGPGCFNYFAKGTTVTLTAQTQNSTFNGWTGDCASAGTHPTCTLVMNTNKQVGASFSTAGSGGCSGFGYLFFPPCGFKLPPLQFSPRFRLF